MTDPAPSTKDPVPIFDILSLEKILKMEEIIFIVKESLEGGYESEALGHAIVTEGDDWNQRKEMAIDAVKCHFDDNQTRLVRLQ